MLSPYPLKNWQKIFLVILSFLIVAFGQPAWNAHLGILTACCGFACFWRVLLDVPKAKQRFWLGTAWFTAVQIVQLSWFASHPYGYIYGVLLFCAVLMGVQWGFLSIWIHSQSLQSFVSILGLTGLWTLLEWSRLFILSGLPFNPVGLTLSSSLYSLQFASLGGIYGLSFWVILTNFILLRAWLYDFRWMRWSFALLIVVFPYAFGLGHLFFHTFYFNHHSERLNVVLVQTALPIEENLTFQSADEARLFVLNEWKHSLSTLKQHVGKSIDLIVFPEYLVPYGTFHSVFSLEEAKALFYDTFPDLVSPLAFLHNASLEPFWKKQGESWLVPNAYLAQVIANLFQAQVLIGLEDSTYVEKEPRKIESVSAAFHFIPNGQQFPPHYAKQVLVPMGEYIPFEWCRTLAAQYGIRGSFTCGKGATIFEGRVPFGVCICYEEMYGHLMRQNRLKGAELLVNLTNDGWYPHSRLPKQHFDHARLRTVENGIPLVRACNTGVTAGIDSLGRTVAILGEDPLKEQDVADALFLEVPLYHYSTLYTRFGDLPILLLSGFFLLLFFILSKRRQLKN